MIFKVAVPVEMGQHGHDRLPVTSDVTPGCRPGSPAVRVIPAYTNKR